MLGFSIGFGYLRVKLLLPVVSCPVAHAGFTVLSTTPPSKPHNQNRYIKFPEKSFCDGLSYRQEFSRVLKKDGVVAATVWESHEDSIFQRLNGVLETLDPGEMTRAKDSDSNLQSVTIDAVSSRSNGTLISIHLPLST